MTPAARRMRRLRERRARGARVVQVEVDVDLLGILEELGLVGPGQADDPDALAFALSMLVEEGVEARRSRIEKNSLRVTGRSKAVIESGA